LPDDAEHVKLLQTSIGDDARIGIHETVLAGTQVPAGKVVGIFPSDRGR
jgi:acetyltransferase-like isoleucine patch superfamily enzyme